MMPVKRRLMARSSGLVSRQRVYQIPDGLEVDEIDHYEVRRSRVLFDDVILVTWHRHRGFWFLFVIGMFAAALAASAFLIGRTEAGIGWIFFACTGGPLLLVFILRLVIGIDEVNVYSRRSQARLRFFFRKARARALMGEITATVRRRQEAPKPPDATVSTESLPAT